MAAVIRVKQVSFWCTYAFFHAFSANVSIWLYTVSQKSANNFDIDQRILIIFGRNINWYNKQSKVGLFSQLT